MALPYDQMNAITMKYYIPKLIDNIMNSNSMLVRIKGKPDMYKKYDGGMSIMQPILYAKGAHGGWFTGAETLDMTDTAQMTSAEWTMKQLHEPLVITRTDELNNSGKAKVLSLIESKMKAAEMTMMDNLGSGLFNAGTAAKQIVGLRSAISSSRTYAGIDSSTYSWWDAQISTAAALTYARVRGMVGDATVDTNKPTVHYTTQDQYDVFSALFQPQQRFTDEKMLDAGFVNIKFEGAPVIVDSHVPSGYWFGVNEKFIQLYVHKDEDFRFEPWSKESNQAVKYAHIYWAGALVCTNPRMQFVFTSLT